MSERRVLAVMGATGNQGGAVLEAALADPAREFAVRALTRDPSSPKARALAARGVEVVRGDANDAASLARAFAGTHAVYGMTSYWQAGSAEREREQGRNIAETARRAGVRHVVWSTLEDTRRVMPPSDGRMPVLQSRYRVPNYDGKAEVNDAFQGVPTTFLLPSFYWDNFYQLQMAPTKGADGAYAWALPMGDARLAGIAVEDIGRAAHGIFKAGDRYLGKRVGLVGEALSMREISDRFAKGMGWGHVRFDDMEPDAFRGLPFPGADVVGNMFQYYRDFEKEVLGVRSVETTRALVPGLLTFDAWLVKNRARFAT